MTYTHHINEHEHDPEVKGASKLFQSLMNVGRVEKMVPCTVVMDGCMHQFKGTKFDWFFLSYTHVM